MERAIRVARHSARIALYPCQKCGSGEPSTPCVAALLMSAPCGGVSGVPVLNQLYVDVPITRRQSQGRRTESKCPNRGSSKKRFIWEGVRHMPVNARSPPAVVRVALHANQEGHPIVRTTAVTAPIRTPASNSRVHITYHGRLSPLSSITRRFAGCHSSALRRKK